MSGHRNFREINPRHISTERQQRIDDFRAAGVTAMQLAELRDRLDMTQSDVAAQLGVTQANISRLEHGDDFYLSTLRSYVTALGGTLEVSAVFPDVKIPIRPSPLHAKKAPSSAKQSATKKRVSRKRVTEKSRSDRRGKTLVKAVAKQASKKK